MGRRIGFGIATGLIFTSVVMIVALVYCFWIAPEGGDSWDVAYFFTHGAFFVLFAIGFIHGLAWNMRRKPVG